MMFILINYADLQDYCMGLILMKTVTIIEDILETIPYFR